MTLELYSIKDELNGFAPPVPLANEDVAKRYFREMLETNPTMRLNKADFSIWYIGEFQTTTGSINKSETGVKLIERG